MPAPTRLPVRAATPQRARSLPGRHRAVPDVPTGRSGLLRTLGAVTAIGIAAGAVAMTQALPERAEAAAHWTTLRSVDVVAGSTSTSSGWSGAATAAWAQLAPAAPTPTERSAATRRLLAQAAADRRIRVSRSAERRLLGGCDGRTPTGHFANGRVPASALCRLTFAPEHRLRADAAVAFLRLGAAYRARFHRQLCLTDSYRSYGSQLSVAARTPGLAAVPGTSQHGWGLAVDLCGGPDVPGSPQRAWMLHTAPRFGWVNPAWARPNGSRPEPWHWEYRGGRTPSR